MGWRSLHRNQRKKLSGVILTATGAVILATCLLVIGSGLTGCEWGTVPIEATVGEYSVSISPASGTVAVGSTVQLTAIVTDAEGDTLAVQVEWASRHPAIATVNSSGLVTGVSAGQAQIKATYASTTATAGVVVHE